MIDPKQLAELEQASKDAHVEQPVHVVSSWTEDSSRPKKPFSIIIQSAPTFDEGEE